MCPPDPDRDADPTADCTTDAPTAADPTDADAPTPTDVPIAPMAADADPIPVDPPDRTIRVLAGECTTTFTGGRERVQRGHVVVVVKPDKTVLVHDADGYQPVAWLTRADSVTVEIGPAAGGAGEPVEGVDGPAGSNSGPDRRADSDAGVGSSGPRPGFGVTARAGDQELRVVSHRSAGWVRFPASAAGVPVGACPDCGGALVRTRGSVACLGCDRDHGLPDGGEVLDAACDDCGLPLVRVRRGAPIEVCLDRRCDPLVDRVRDLFDRTWTCPDCGADLRVIERGGLLLGCDAYPDCETAFAFPAGPVVDRCGCGLPVFRTAGGRRCLDRTCDRFEGSAEPE